MGTRASTNATGPGRPPTRLPHPQPSPPSRQRRSGRRLDADELERAHQWRLELINRPLHCMIKHEYGGKSWAGVLIPREADLIEELALDQVKGYAGYYDYSGPGAEALDE